MPRSALALLLTAALAPAAAADTAGAALYRKKVCTACHGADGSGNTPVGKSLGAHDLRAEEVQKKTDAQLAETIAKGRGRMPAFGSSLTEAEIMRVISHVRTLARRPR